MRTLAAIRYVLPLVAAALILPACGNDDDDNGIGGGGPFVPPTPFAVALSAGGPDQLQSVTAGPNGSFYAAGYAAASPTDPRFIVVVKITASGALDTTFGGGDGIATTNVEFAGGTDTVDVATQPDGKIIVLTTVANASVSTDRDLAVLRLDASGALDTTFASPTGIRIIDLNSANPNGSATDQSRGLAVHPTSGLIFIHALQRGEGTAVGGGARTDTDFAVVRVTADGNLDGSYAGGDDKHLLDIEESDATPRAIAVLDDGSVIASGYANSPSIGTVQVVVYRLTPAGALDPNFATGGFFHQAILALQTEIYGFAVHGTHLVTAGYGRATGTLNDWVSLRFAVADGVRDTAWGGAPNGAVMVVPSALGSNCRTGVALPGGKTMLVGSTGPNNQTAQDAVFAVLDANGVLDAAYGGSPHLFPFGTNGGDQFWGGAVSGNNALLVGHKGVATQTAGSNDDAYAVLFPVR